MKRRRSKRMKKIDRVIFFVSFLLMFGVVGGMEQNTISVGHGIIALFISLVLVVISGIRGGLIEW